MKPDFEDPLSVVVIQIGKIGDMILTTPLFSELKILFPNSVLTVLASEINKDIPLNHNSVDKVIVFSKNIMRNLFLLKYLFIKTDIWIDTKDNYSKTGGILFKLFKPVFSMGYLFPDDKIKFSVYLNEYASGKHAVDLNLSPVNYFKNSKIKLTALPSYNIPAATSKKFTKLNTEENIQNVLINVSAGSRSRYLPESTWTELIKLLSNDKKLKFTLTGLGEDKKIVDFILDNVDNEIVKYVPAENILELSEIIRKSDLVITPDTSAVHICSAFSIPVVAIYPDVKWNLEKFSPLSEKNVILLSEETDSVKSIKAEDICEAANRLLKEIS